MRKNLILCLLLIGVLLTGLTGCSNTSISNTPDTNASIQLSQYDASIKMKKIGGNAIGLQDGFASQIQKMTSATVAPNETDYSILTDSLLSAKESLNSNINELKSLNAPTASKKHKEALLNALVSYQNEIDKLITSSNAANKEDLKNNFNTFQNVSIALQGAIDQIN